MLCQSAVVLASIVIAAPAEEVVLRPSVRLSTLPPGQELRVETEKRVYKILIIDGETGESIVSSSLDGQLFGVEERMFIIGSTRTNQSNDGGIAVVLMGELQAGLQIEWGRGSLDEADRGVTSVVKSIDLIVPDDLAP